MARLFSNRERPFDMGVLPTELLARDPSAPVVDSRLPGDRFSPGEESILPALQEHFDFCVRYLDREVAPARAPPTTMAFVFRGGCGREPRPGEPGAEWILGTNALRTDLRCAEVAVVLAGYVRVLGWPAQGHVAGATLVSIERLAQRAGVTKDVAGTLKAPLMERGFRLGVVTTSCEMASDLPLAALAWPSAEAYMGKPGTRPGWAEAEEAKRPLHMGRYAMERIRRVDEPTTLVLRDEIRRMTKRADLFTRALAGDLGEKPAKERGRFR